MSGNPISNTGLIASPKKTLRRRKLPVEFNLSKCAIAKPVQFSLRPFGGLFNPYSRGCSILCNHPGPNEVKDVVKQVKEQCIAEVKGHIQKEDGHDLNVDYITDPNHIPEEFFRRYTGSDSRPLTPTPTIASGRTRNSAGSQYFQARRCFTPDPIKNSDRERKQIVLDLRRSHSQETLFWNASSELSPALHGHESISIPKVTKSERPISGPGKNMRLCEQEARKKSAERKAQQLKETEMKSASNSIICINDLDDADEENNGARRRGKKKKKSKGPNGNAYHVSQEPETQIATMGPDSPNQSARPSLVPNANTVPRSTTGGEGKRASGTVNNCLQSTFLTEDTLKILRRGLNIDIVESAFEKYMHKALKEALRTIPPDQDDDENEALRVCKETVTIRNVDTERWLPMPRKYTRSSARFTLPINTRDLVTLTPFAYVSHHIWISDHRKQLYRYVFIKFLDETSAVTNERPTAHSLTKANGSQDTTPSDTDKHFNFFCDRERFMNFRHLEEALKHALGFHGTIEKINKIKEVLVLTEEECKELNFRSWSGIVAFAERYLNDLTIDEDPSDEVEIADFESLERKFSYINVSENMKYILNFIKYNTK